MLAARTIVHEMRLDMKIGDVEYQGDGTKATFYYTSEQRIDFRDLIRKLADRFKVKVDMKQVGSRQEAGRIGGIGSCGRELCCSTWLTDFRSVTTSAARYQQLALNPQKLAGQCGKLKCCLNYELDMYIEAVKSYPSQNAKLKTKQGTGMHMKTDIFEEKMWYIFKMPGSASVMAGLSIERVREIQTQNREGIEPDIDFAQIAAEAEAELPKEEQEPEYERVGGEDELTRFDSKSKSGKRRRGGREGDRRGGGGGGQRSQGQGQPRQAQPRPPAAPGDPAAPRPPQGPRPAQEPRGDRPAGEGRRDRGRRGRDRRGPRPDRPQGGAPGGGPSTPPAA